MGINPEISKTITAADLQTNYHDEGEGAPVLLIHGSGPGVTAWANWRLIIPLLSKSFRVVAPDMMGFGYTQGSDNEVYHIDAWVTHLVDFVDSLGLKKVSVVGNSFGGAIALALAIGHPERVDKIVLMGAAGVKFELTHGLNAAWGYTPSPENMRQLLELFAYDHSIITDDLVEMRYLASIRPGFQERFSQMFPHPRQNGIDMLAQPEELIKAIEHDTLVIHGRDDKIIPVSNSLKLNQLIDNSELHIFGRCGHWTQIEYSSRFATLVSNFLSDR